MQFDIETKVFPDKPDNTLPPEEFVKTLLAVIRAAGMTERVMIQSFDWRTLRLVHDMEPGMRTVYLTVQSATSNNVADSRWTDGLLVADYPSIAHMIKAAGGNVWAPNFNSIDESAIKRAHEPRIAGDPVDRERRRRHAQADGLGSRRNHHRLPRSAARADGGARAAAAARRQSSSRTLKLLTSCCCVFGGTAS